LGAARILALLTLWVHLLPPGEQSKGAGHSILVGRADGSSRRANIEHFDPCPGASLTSTIGVMGEKGERRAWLPPRWFVVLFWHGHRALVRATRGRWGLWRPKPGRWGALRLTTIGRRTGKPHQVLVGYFQDGPRMITLAMNGWGPAEPSWWLNLQAHSEAIAQTRDGMQHVHAHRAVGTERDRLWSRWAEIDKNLDAYAARRPGETSVVVLEPPEGAESS
jgi:F420H(2)-dependent quinone reductase